MRINQYIAAATDLSRRAADSAVADGRVTVDGHVVNLGASVDAAAAVTLDGKTLKQPAAHTYIMFHKPVGYVTSRARQGNDPTIYDLLPPQYHRLQAVGRLDRDSSGLLLMSDDGAFIQRHTHPSHNKEKVYELELDRPLTASHRVQLETGVKLSDGPSRLRVNRVRGSRVTVALSEGRNRQVRRTLGNVGYTVRRLHRVQVGPYSLGNLAHGAYQQLPEQTA